MSAKAYTGERIEVTFDPARCLHAAECVRGLPQVFDTRQRPWIQPDGADPATVAEVVRRCPSGALHYRLADGPAEEPESPGRVTAEPDGPIWVRGALRITVGADEADGGSEIEETRAALCRCGESQNRPFCDASGPCTGWSAS
mgnify:CR=1 FL=1